ncbi:MAG: class I adenylate-forming enzyme family protein, partial [Myxococcota bacterium]
MNPDTLEQSPVRAFDWIEAHSTRTPHKPVQTDLSSGRRFTFGEMNDRVGRIAEYLASIGVNCGDRVGLVMPNSSDVLEIIFATWRLGAVAVPLDPRLTSRELTAVIKEAQPGVMFFDHTLDDTVDQLRTSTGVPAWIATDGAGGDTPYEMVMRSVDPRLTKNFAQPSSAPCLLLYTPGTTGRSKGTIATHAMLTHAALSFIQACRITQDSVHLACMPMSCAAGLSAFIYPVLYMGGHVVIQRIFDSNETNDALHEPALGITHFYGTPSHYRALHLHSNQPKIDVATRVMAVGGRSRFAHIQQIYGTTETLGAGLIMPVDQSKKKAGSVGLPGLYTEARIVREDGLRRRDRSNSQSKAGCNDISHGGNLRRTGGGGAAARAGRAGGGG